MVKHKEKEVPKCDSDIFKLSQMGDITLIKKLFEEGLPPPEDSDSKENIPIEVNSVDELGYTPLCYAARAGHKPALMVLLEHEANIEQPSYGGLRPLHHACNVFAETVMEVLLEAGADANAKDDKGNTPIHWIVGRGALSMMMTLVDKGGANLDCTNAEGSTPLMRGASAGQKTVTAKLIALRANLDKADKDGNTALHYAARGGFTDIVQQCLDAKCKIDIKNKGGKTAQAMAEEHEEHAIAEIIGASGN